MRRRRAPKQQVTPDPKYNSRLVTKMVNMVMVQGKKSLAENVMYTAMEILEKKTGKNPLDVFKKAVENTRPLLEVKPRRVGGATYQVPVEIRQDRGTVMSLRWMRNFARQRKGKPMEEKLAQEILDSFNGEGSTVKKRDDMHKMAESNKAFAHYRW